MFEYLDGAATGSEIEGVKGGVLQLKSVSKLAWHGTHTRKWICQFVKSFLSW